jgi:pimeloyl-ACP methyl ester carboxylesterase
MRTSRLEAFSVLVTSPASTAIIQRSECGRGMRFPRGAPDVVSGQPFATHTGFAQVQERGVCAADGLPADIVYAGFSLGAMSAQQLAQTRSGALGALLFHSCIPAAEFGSGWPAEVQVHGMDADPFFVEDVTAAVARSPELVAWSRLGSLTGYRFFNRWT